MLAHDQGSVCQMLSLTWILSKWSKGKGLVKGTHSSGMTRFSCFLTLILVHFPNMISQPPLCLLFALESEFFSVTCNPEHHNWYTSLWDFHKCETEAQNGGHPKEKKICLPKTHYYLRFLFYILCLISLIWERHTENEYSFSYVFIIATVCVRHFSFVTYSSGWVNPQE